LRRRSTGMLWSISVTLLRLEHSTSPPGCQARARQLRTVGRWPAQKRFLAASSKPSAITPLTPSAGLSLMEASFRGFYPRERDPPDLMAPPPRYPDELIQRRVRSRRRASGRLPHIAHDLGTHPETLGKRVRQPRLIAASGPSCSPHRSAEEVRRFAQGELRAAPRERDPHVGSLFRSRTRPGQTEVTR
jgi:hypothetical protein